MDNLQILEFISTPILGFLGGIVGAFFKFWVQDFRNWAKSILNKKEKAILSHFKFSGGLIDFENKKYDPKKLLWQIDKSVDIEDLGECKRLIELGIIEIAEIGENRIRYRLTGKGYKKIKSIKEWSQQP